MSPLGHITDQMGSNGLSFWFSWATVNFDAVRVKFLVLVKDGAQRRFLSRINSVRYGGFSLFLLSCYLCHG